MSEQSARDTHSLSYVPIPISISLSLALSFTSIRNWIARCIFLRYAKADELVCAQECLFHNFWATAICFFLSIRKESVTAGPTKVVFIHSFKAWSFLLRVFFGCFSRFRVSTAQSDEHQSNPIRKIDLMHANAVQRKRKTTSKLISWILIQSKSVIPGQKELSEEWGENHHVIKDNALCTNECNKCCKVNKSFFFQ